MSLLGAEHVCIQVIKVRSRRTGDLFAMKVLEKNVIEKETNAMQ